MRLPIVLPFSALVVIACNEPTDLHRARAIIDSTQSLRRADSLRQAVVDDSLRDGHHVYRDAEGRPVMEGDLLDGERHGVWTAFAPNGKAKSRSEYAHGRLQGLTTVFHENGALYYQGQNRHGQPVGAWTFHDAAGVLVKTVNYDSSGAVINDR